MVTLNQINDFLNSKKLAIAGVSRDQKKFGYLVFKDLKNKGYDVCPVNPNAEVIDDIKCYKNLSEIPGDYRNLLIVTPENKTMQVVMDAYNKGIKKIWIQQKSENREILIYAKEKGLNLIYKRCIFMFTEPVTGGHKFHRTINKIFGNYPKLQKKN